MASAKVVNAQGEETGSVRLPKSIFAVEPSRHAVYQAVTAYLANQRHGNASAKSRGEVSRSGAKPRRQKGFGMARIGTLRSPLLVGGGVAFGPRPHRWKTKLPKKVGRLAVKSAFSLKAKEGRVRLLESLELDRPRTRVMADVLTALGLQQEKTLYLASNPTSQVLKSCRNIPNLTVRPAKDVCTYDILNSDTVLISKEGLKDIEERFAG